MLTGLHSAAAMHPHRTGTHSQAALDAATCNPAVGPQQIGQSQSQTPMQAARQLLLPRLTGSSSSGRKKLLANSSTISGAGHQACSSHTSLLQSGILQVQCLVSACQLLVVMIGRTMTGQMMTGALQCVPQHSRHTSQSHLQLPDTHPACSMVLRMLPGQRTMQGHQLEPGLQQQGLHLLLSPGQGWQQLDRGLCVQQ